MMHNTLGKKISSLLTHTILLLIAFTTIIPFYWMACTSFKDDMSIFVMPPKLFPDPFILSNYTRVFELVNMWLAFYNSIKIAVIATAGTIFSSSVAAYAFSKIRFKGSQKLFGLFFSTMLIPGQVTLIPLFILFTKMGWIDTHLPLIVPSIMLNAYGIFMLRQFMMGLPDSYVESAKIDGCNHFIIYARIIMPLCKPAAVTFGLFTFIHHWNNFLSPLIYLNQDNLFTIPLVINSFRTMYSVDWGLLMAASTVSILPIIVLYFFSQRFFIEGIALAGLKA